MICAAITGRWSATVAGEYPWKVANVAGPVASDSRVRVVLGGVIYRQVLATELRIVQAAFDPPADPARGTSPGLSPIRRKARLPVAGWHDRRVRPACAGHLWHIWWAVSTVTTTSTRPGAPRSTGRGVMERRHTHD